MGPARGGGGPSPQVCAACIRSVRLEGSQSKRAMLMLNWSLLSKQARRTEMQIQVLSRSVWLLLLHYGNVPKT